MNTKYADFFVLLNLKLIVKPIKKNHHLLKKNYLEIPLSVSNELFLAQYWEVFLNKNYTNTMIAVFV